MLSRRCQRVGPRIIDITRMKVDYGPQETRRDPESPLMASAMVWRALEQLSPRRRAVIVLREIEGASMQETARLLGVTAVTVRWHLSRGRYELRRILERTSGRREERGKAG